MILLLIILIFQGLSLYIFFAYFVVVYILLGQEHRTSSMNLIVLFNKMKYVL